MKPDHSWKRGVSLIGTMWLIALLASLVMSFLGVFLVTQGRLSGHKQAQQAAAMAVSGRDYAAAMLRAGRWKGPTRYQSPVFPNGESFEVEVKAAGSGWHIISLGKAGSTQLQLEGKP